MDAVFGAWHGGAGYAFPYLPADLERFDSVQSAADALRERERSPGLPHTFYYCNQPPQTSVCPAVEDSEMRVWLIDPTDIIDPYPDYIIRLDAGDPVIERA